MLPLKVFQHFYVQLVELLPMKNDLFIAMLYKNNLLPGNLKEVIDSSHTSISRASKFLDDVIKPTIRHDDRTRFDALLAVMKSCDDDALKKLSETISLALNQSPNSHAGMCTTIGMPCKFLYHMFHVALCHNMSHVRT